MILMKRGRGFEQYLKRGEGNMSASACEACPFSAQKHCTGVYEKVLSLVYVYARSGVHESDCTTFSRVGISESCLL